MSSKDSHSFVFTSALLKAEAATALNQCIGGLYSEGLFLKPDRAVELARKGLLFLHNYAKLASLTFERRQRRFPFIPKCHYLHHQFLDLLFGGRSSPWTLNILAFANQLSEDFVGRPSRLARRVSPRATSLRVIERTFLAVRNVLSSDAGT